MNTDTEDIGAGGIAKKFTPTEIFDLLSNKRRRFVLHSLSKMTGAVSFDDLVEQITLWEYDPTSDHFERVATDLYHAHLPKLEAANVIRFDAEREVVELRDAADQLKPYFVLAEADDFR